MKSSVFILTAVMAVFFSACGGPAANTGTANANSANANTAKPVAAAPTKDALFEMDKKANEAALKGDGKFFDGFLSDKFVSYEHGKRMTKADVVKMLAEMKCETKTWSLDDAQMAMIDPDTAVITYKGTFDGSCIGPDGKSMKMPSPIRAASVYVRSGDKWLGAFHGESPIVDPKSPPMPLGEKKAEPKKEAPKKDEKAGADAETTGTKSVAGDANTDALVKLHTSGWEAWKAKDAKKFEELTAANLAVVDPMGSWFGTKSEAIKHLTEMKCEGINNVKVSEGVATALSPAAEVLTSKGTADGTCEGQKNGDLYQTAFYVKEGDAWKLAFLFEALPMGGM